jgi:hypothetical protein
LYEEEMTSSGGMKIGLKATSALLDTVFGLKDGSVRQQSHADLGTQLMSSGPLANLLATTSGNVVFFATKEAMDAAVDYSAPQAAWVFNDADPANNGAYYFTNGDPGFWTFMLNFPNSWVYATVSAGDANAIELSMPATVSPSTMIFFEVQDDNLAGGVTVSVNGGDPMDLVDFRGNELEAGALGEGALAVFFPLGDGTARMVIDNTAEAAAAASAASAASSNTSALASSDSALAAAASATSAERFATAPEDEETSAGSGLYSAFHWAQKAMDVVLGDIADQISAAAAAVPSTSDVLAFVENATGDLKKITWANFILSLRDDEDIATKSGVEDLTNKTLTSPVILTPTGVVSVSAQSLSNAEKLQARRNVASGWGVIDEIALVGQSYIDILNITDGYDVIRFSGWYITSLSVSLLLRLSSDNGATFFSAADHPYQYISGTNASVGGGYSSTAGALYLGINNVNAGSYMALNAMLVGFNSTSQKLLQSIQSGAISGGNLNISMSNSWSGGSDNGVMNALRIFPSAGVLSQGRIFIEGLKK